MKIENPGFERPKNKNEKASTEKEVLDRLEKTLNQSHSKLSKAHSSYDEVRVRSFLNIVDVLESVGTELSASEIEKNAEHLANHMLNHPRQSLEAFKKPESSRVQSLLS
jgi:triphosphoribosyl-dephospho-CoA synthetase